MEARFYCSDPLNTVGRVMDTARRMGLGLDAMRIDRTDDSRYALALVLIDPPENLALNFLSRISAYTDLERQETCCASAPEALPQPVLHPAGERP